MESDAKAELNDVERFARKARSAATEFSTNTGLLLIVADLILIAVFIAFGLSTWIIVGWIAFLAVFYSVVRMRRRARPRAPWATPESRRHSFKMTALTLAINAVWIPLFFIARPIALGLLVAVLLYSLLATFKYRHA